MFHVFGSSYIRVNNNLAPFPTWRLISNMAADEESWRRTVLERTSSVLQEAARKIESELNNTMRCVLSYMY